MLVYFGKTPQVNYHFVMNITTPTPQPPIEIDLSGYEYTEEGSVAVLTKYVGSDVDLTTPGGKSQGVLNV